MFRQKVVRLVSALVLAATAATSGAHWHALTSPYTGAGSEIIVRPVASVLRIGIIFVISRGIGFVSATLVVGKLPKRLGRNEVEFDDGPSLEARAAESVHKRLAELEYAQKTLTATFEKHQRAHE